MNNIINMNNAAAAATVVKIQNTELHKYATPLGEMIKRVSNEPKLKFIYSGIKEKSIGIIFGPSKAGKTMFCENLGISIASGTDRYLDLPIEIDNRKVLFISFEEHYTNRTERNLKQARAISEKQGQVWVNNYIVVNEDIPRYTITKEQWRELADLINNIKPGVVFLDSLTHMYEGSIEDSKTAVELTKKLRYLSEKTDTTIIAIHHTHKMYGQPLSVDTIAGSRVIAQELDFMIGVNRTPDGKMYIKDVAFRYAECFSDVVRTFTIDGNCWLSIDEITDESKLLSITDGRKDETNIIQIGDFLNQQKAAGTPVVPLSVLLNKFVVTSEMSRQTLFNNLDKMQKHKMITKPEKGQYMLAA